MRSAFVLAAAAALALVAGAAAGASELMTLRKGAIVAITEWQLDEAIEMLDDYEALGELISGGQVAVVAADFEVYVSDAIDEKTAKVRVKGRTGYFFTRRYNLERLGNR